MAFVVEDGNGLADANSYATVAYADAYFSDRAVVSWAALTTEVKQAALIKGTDYIDTVNAGHFIDTKYSETQALEFPRVNCVASTPPIALPSKLLKATCEYALRAVTAPLLADPVRDESGMLLQGKTETVGPITESVQYAAVYGVQDVTDAYPAADLLLSTLLRQGSKVIRG